MKAYLLFYQESSVLLLEREGPLDYLEIPSVVLLEDYKKTGGYKQSLEKELGVSFVAIEQRFKGDIVLLASDLEVQKVNPNLYFYPLKDLKYFVLLRGHKKIIESFA